MREIVVGSRVETADHLGFVIPRGDHNNWHRGPLPQPPNKIRTVHVRQIQFEHDQLSPSLLIFQQRIFTGGNEIEAIAGDSSATLTIPRTGFPSFTTNIPGFSAWPNAKLSLSKTVMSGRRLPFGYLGVLTMQLYGQKHKRFATWDDASDERRPGSWTTKYGQNDEIRSKLAGVRSPLPEACAFRHYCGTTAGRNAGNVSVIRI